MRGWWKPELQPESYCKASREQVTSQFGDDPSELVFFFASVIMVPIPSQITFFLGFNYHRIIPPSFKE